MFDPEAVRHFEHSGWEQAAADYNATFAHATVGFVDALLDAAEVAPGVQVLDLCCGTGIVTKAAARRGAIPTGIDFSEAMLAQARRTHPDLNFEQGDAEALPYPDGMFAAAVSNFGMHHIPRPELAAAEAHRILRPGGRFAFTTWAAPVENAAWRLLFDAIRMHGDPAAAAKTPPSGGTLASPEAAEKLLRSAGFTNTAVEILHREWGLEGAADLIGALRRGTVRTAALIAAQPADAIPDILASIEAGMAEYRRGNGFAVPIVAILASGTKSAG